MAAPSVSVLAWLRPEKIKVAFADAAWELEARNASDWLGAIAMDFTTLSGVFPGLIRDCDVDHMLPLMKDISRVVAMQEVAQKVVEAAGGRDWWWTVNLSKRALGNWILVNGFLVRQGVRADSTSFPDWLDACYTWIWEKADEDNRIKLDIELSIPPLGMRGNRKANKRMVEAFQAD